MSEKEKKHAKQKDDQIVNEAALELRELFEKTTSIRLLIRLRPDRETNAGAEKKTSPEAEVVLPALPTVERLCEFLKILLKSHIQGKSLKRKLLHEVVRYDKYRQFMDEAFGPVIKSQSINELTEKLQAIANRVFGDWNWKLSWRAIRPQSKSVPEYSISRIGSAYLQTRLRRRDGEALCDADKDVLREVAELTESAFKIYFSCEIRARLEYERGKRSLYS